MPPRAAESQSESEVHVSDPSQPFQPRENDDETLFEVIEITDETKDKYKVRWQGDDPKTKKPWSQSWVPKGDCTDDLVLTWKKEKKRNERRISKKNGRDSTASKPESRSVASTSRTKSRSESIAKSSNVTKRLNERSPSAGPSSPKSKVTKHRLEEVVVDLPLASQPRTSVSVGRSNVRSPTHSSPTSDAGRKGTKRKRKRDEAQSANSSANQTNGRRIQAVPVEVDSDEGQMTRSVANPPRKKRRITSDSSPPPKLLTHRGERKSHDVQNGGGRLQSLATVNDEEEAADDYVVKEHFGVYDEEEERMVEVALSDGYHSAGINDPNDKTRNVDVEVDPQNGNLEGEEQQARDKRKDKAVFIPQKAEEEESDEVEILEAPDRPRPSARSNPGPIVHVNPSKRPGARMTAQPPPSHWKTPSSNKHRRQPVTARVPPLVSKILNKARPAATTKKSKDSSFVPGSSSNRNPQPKVLLFAPDSDSDRFPPPERHRKPQLPKLATKQRRIEVPHVTSIHDSDESDREVDLSPRARQRLAIFDAEVMRKKTRVGEKKQAKEVNGKGEVSTSKRSNSLGNSRPGTSTAHPPLRFDTQSYNMDVVPETELETSQEDKLKTSSIPVKNHEKHEVPPIPPSTPGPISKSLRPLPHISPSAFYGHLQPPNSSLPETINEPSSSHERRPEIEAIEQFESPEKERGKTVVVLNKNGVASEAGKEHRLEPTTHQRESAEDVWESESVRRGQEIAEQAGARNRISASRGTESSPETTKKKSVQEVIARAASRSHSDDIAGQPDENDDENQQGEEEGVADASTSVVPPASGPPAISQDQPPLADGMWPMHDDRIGLNGDVGELEDADKTHDGVDETTAGINLELLRQEEEESSQDIMADQRQHSEREEGMGDINPSEDRNLGLPPVRTRLAPRNGDTRGPISEAELKSVASSRSLQKRIHRDDAPRAVTRSRSRSKTPSVVTNSRNNAQGKKKLLTIPSPVLSGREPEPELPNSPVDDFQNEQGSSTASPVFAAQISSLQTQVHEKQVEIDSLQQVLGSLREQLRSSEDRKAHLEVDGQRQTTELKSQWAHAMSAWESERTLLAAKTTASEQSRIQAEQDREFIREQYGNASAYVTTVREEKKELEQRVEIAEAQSKQGVELIKTTFELQVAKLQDESKAWRRMAEFAIQKDIQTNDDIRKRAAEEPELRVLCGRQKKSLKEARAKIDGLQADLQEKTNLCDASKVELEHCRKENARLHSDLNEALIKLDRIGRSGEESTHGNGHEFVYRCMWRAETDNAQSGCPEVFLTMRELEQHIDSGHLAPH